MRTRPEVLKMFKELQADPLGLKKPRAKQQRRGDTK